ncbi:DUF6511 domain-containing protein [Bauldia litoralis]
MARRKRTAPPAHPLFDHRRPRGDGLERHQPLRGSGSAADPGRARGGHGPDVALGRIVPCALCGRQDRGFGYCHHLRFDRFPHHRFCSMRCLDAGSALAKWNNGMIDKTDIEIQAIKEARRFLAEVLTEMDLMTLFHDRSAAEIDRIIEACIDGFQDAMQRQADAVRNVPFNDTIPF